MAKKYKNFEHRMMAQLSDYNEDDFIGDDFVMQDYIEEVGHRKYIPPMRMKDNRPNA